MYWTIQNFKIVEGFLKEKHLCCTSKEKEKSPMQVSFCRVRKRKYFRARKNVVTARQLLSYEPCIMYIFHYLGSIKYYHND